jgi:hypothetical protein
VVGAAGLEPIHHRYTPLKRACLPIPPPEHNLRYIKKVLRLKATKKQLFAVFAQGYLFSAMDQMEAEKSGQTGRENGKWTV